MKLTAQMYTVRELCGDEAGLYKTLSEIRNIGYTAVQVSGFPYEAKRLAEMVQELGLEVCATHTRYDWIRDDLDRLIAEHRLFGCNTIGVGMLPGEYSRTKEGYQRFIADFNTIAERLAKEGMQLGYHNHRFEFERYGDQTAFDLMIEQMHPTASEFILDTYWVQAGGANPEEYVRRLAGKIRTIHLKDMKIVDDEAQFAEIGQGNINFLPILKACEETGVKFAAVEQDICPGCPLESLKISYEYLKDIWNWEV